MSEPEHGQALPDNNVPVFYICRVVQEASSEPRAPTLHVTYSRHPRSEEPLEAEFRLNMEVAHDLYLALHKAFEPWHSKA